jgi:sugar phosphate isomerase/epimerase
MYASIRDDTVQSAYPNILSGLKALGLSAIEADFRRDVSLPSLTDKNSSFPVTTSAEIAAYKKHLDEHGVTISAFLLANNLNADDMEVELGWCTKALRVAHALGIKAVRIDSAMKGQQELPFDERVKKFVTGIRALIDATPDAPVDMGIENHGYQGNDPNFLHGVFDGVGSSRIGMTLDTGNFYWRGHALDKTYAVIKEFAPLAKHTHIKNINYPVDKRNVTREMGWEYGQFVCPIPDGDVDHKIVVGFLKDAGYDRDLCIEDESLGKFPMEERIKVLTRDAEYIKGLAK